LHNLCYLWRNTSAHKSCGTTHNPHKREGTNKMTNFLQKLFGKIRQSDAGKYDTAMQQIDESHTIVIQHLLHGWHISVYNSTNNGDTVRLNNVVFSGNFDSSLSRQQIVDIAKSKVE
jgi:hypothetical protein